MPDVGHVDHRAATVERFRLASEPFLRFPWSGQRTAAGPSAAWPVGLESPLIGMRPYTLLSKIADRLATHLRTAHAREVAILDKTARLTGSARLDNIGGDPASVRIGAHSTIAGHIQRFAHAGSIVVGDWVYVGSGSRIWSASSVQIGDRVLIAHNVSIIDTNSHPIDAAARFRQTRAILTSGHPREDPGLLSSPIVIGDDAWISYGASVLRGVAIGEGAIVGAASVVTHDVPPWTVVVGNPARVVKTIDRPRERSPV